MKKILAVVFGVGMLVFGLVNLSNATPIIFTHSASGSFSGTIDGTDFTTSGFTINAIGDTNDRLQLVFKSGFLIDHLAASIDIAGVGKYDFIIPTATFASSIFKLGFGARGAGARNLFIGPSDGLVEDWGMLSSYGPITGSGGLYQWGNNPVYTTGGVLFFDKNFDNTATFQAQVNPIPEPATMLLLGTGLVGVAGAARRRKKK